MIALMEPTAKTATTAATARHLSDVEVAKILRKELKAAFPATKFSVRCGRGSAITVEWTDGPTKRRVENVVGRFEGKSFDGMTDSTTYAPPFEYAGELVRTYAFIFTSREISPTFLARLVSAIATYYRIEAPAIVEGWIMATREQKMEAELRAGCEWAMLIHRAAGNRTLVTFAEG